MEQGLCAWVHFDRLAIMLFGIICGIVLYLVTAIAVEMVWDRLHRVKKNGRL